MTVISKLKKKNKLIKITDLAERGWTDKKRSRLGAIQMI